MIDKIRYGYRPVLPFEIKDVRADTQAIKMEKSNADYKADQVKKQIKNDKNCGLGGKDLDKYKNDLRAEATHIINRKISSCEFLMMSIKKLFGCDLKKYIRKHI